MHPIGFCFSYLLNPETLYKAHQQSFQYLVYNSLQDSRDPHLIMISLFLSVQVPQLLQVIS